MTKMLTKEQATQTLKTALEHARLNILANYRLGQAIWNILPDELKMQFHNTKHDFFYWTDDAKVVNVFMDNYVEQENKE